MRNPGADDASCNVRPIPQPPQINKVHPGALRCIPGLHTIIPSQNFRPAAARYNKALTHAAKFVDLSVPPPRSNLTRPRPPRSGPPAHG